MRPLAVLLLLWTSVVHAQSTPAGAPAQAQTSLTQALVGQWTGVLEYRDYSEPADSPKRVELPTWLTVTSRPDGSLGLMYTYDDGPGKILQEADTLKLDLGARSYAVTSSAGVDAKVQTFRLEGEDRLKDGRGTLMLVGPGLDNNKPVEIRTTWTVRRNLLSWLEEIRPAGSSEPFAFRHRYLFTRHDAPAPTTPLPK
jgi:hypothetical protein